MAAWDLTPADATRAHAKRVAAKEARGLARAGRFWLVLDGLGKAPRVVQLAAAAAIALVAWTVVLFWPYILGVVLFYSLVRLWIAHRVRRAEIPYGHPRGVVEWAGWAVRDLGDWLVRKGQR